MSAIYSGNSEPPYWALLHIFPCTQCPLDIHERRCSKSRTAPHNRSHRKTDYKNIPETNEVTHVKRFCLGKFDPVSYTHLIEPHLHNALEIVCVTSGSLELGVGQELYHMEKGDIGFVFPDVIHHYQVCLLYTSRQPLENYCIGPR